MSRTLRLGFGGLSIQLLRPFCSNAAVRAKAQRIYDAPEQQGNDSIQCLASEI